MLSANQFGELGQISGIGIAAGPVAGIGTAAESALIIGVTEDVLLAQIIGGGLEKTAIIIETVQGNQDGLGIWRGPTAQR